MQWFNHRAFHLLSREQARSGWLVRLHISSDGEWSLCLVRVGGAGIGPLTSGLNDSGRPKVVIKIHTTCQRQRSGSLLPMLRRP